MENYPIIDPIAESIEDHYNSERIGISFNGKTIIDLGASNGDSASYFIRKGAKLVIAVEGQTIYLGKKTFDDLMKNSQKFNGKIIPVFMLIESSKQVEDLIIQYKPDIIKSDIEGAEKYLYEINDEIWKLVPEYLIETHEGYLGGGLDILMLIKCEKTKYKIMYNATHIAHMIYAKKEE